MIPSLAAKIAWRYLSARKSHSAINTISIISMCGVGVATMAIVCVLSVFNGFRQVLGDKLDLLTSEVLVEPSHGKVISDGDSLCMALVKLPEVKDAACMVSDNALILFSNREMPIQLVGVDPERFAAMTSVRKMILEGGEYALSFADTVSREDATSGTISDENMLFATAEDLYADSPDMIAADPLQYRALVSVGVASSMQIYLGDTSYLYIYAPRRSGGISMGNPAMSFVTDSLQVCGVFRSDQAQYDANTVFVDLSLARRLLQYDHEASAIQIQLRPGCKPAAFIRELQQQLGDGYVVKDRLMQHDINFKMVSIEKWIAFLLLGFILLIASFNIISALSMMVIDKEHYLRIIACLGAPRRMIGRIFLWLSIYVNAIGAIGGSVTGLILCLLQQHLGLIGFGDAAQKMIIDAYPVKVQVGDIPAVLALVVGIALLTSWVTVRFSRSRIITKR